MPAESVPAAPSPSQTGPAEPAPGLASEARVLTAAPGRYLQQLCKHFAHKIPVLLEEDAGRIDFDAGTCALRATEADGGTLVMRVTARDAEGLARLEEVVARHLLRFAFREPPEIRWSRPAG